MYMDHVRYSSNCGCRACLPLITTAGERAAWRFLDFFTATFRNPNTREAYLRAVIRFFAWCEGRRLPNYPVR